MHSKGLILLFVAVVLLPSRIFGAWTDFVPTPLTNEANLDVFSSYERDNHSTGSKSARWDDIFIMEKITFFSNGYSYHPRFLQYQFSIAGLGKQEDYNSTVLDSPGWTFGSGLEYYARLLLLPDHPYNVDAYASRYEPKYKEQAATAHDSVATSHGISFRYREKPYFLYAGYGQDSIDSQTSSSDVRRFRLAGEYFKRYHNGNELSFNGGLNPTWFSNSQGIDGSSMEYVLGNFLNLWGVRLNSSFTKSSFDQESSFQSIKNDQLAWYELLNAYLPWNFRTDLSFRYQDNKSDIGDTADAESRTLSDKSRDVQADITHKLYNSLDSTYSFLYNTRRSPGGNTTTLFNGLGFSYTKAIPWGTILAGINLGRADTDNVGQDLDIVNEPFSSIPVPGSFTLPEENVERASIIVFLRSPLPPFETILLRESVNYVLIPVLTTFEIQVVALPPRFPVPGTYDFLASYSIATGQFKLRTDTFGGNVSVELFDNLLTPYFNYVTVGTDVLSGVPPGVPVDSTTYTAGMLVHRGPLRVRGEYQNVEWDVGPYESWRAEVQYVGDLNAATSVYASASYLNRHYSKGTSTFQSEAYTEQTTSASGSIRRQLFWPNMYVSAAGSYSRLEGLVDGNAYSVNASWLWTIGTLDVSVGVSAYESATKGEDILSTERDHQFVYFDLRRRLF